MSAQGFVMLLNVFYLLMMGLVSLVGTAVMLELVFALLRENPRQKTWLSPEPEDA